MAQHPLGPEAGSGGSTGLAGSQDSSASSLQGHTCSAAPPPPFPTVTALVLTSNGTRRPPHVCFTFPGEGLMGSS